MEQVKNKIVLYTGSGEDKKRIELFDFNSLDIVALSDGEFYYRIICDDKIYRYPRFATVIASIIIYERN